MTTGTTPTTPDALQHPRSSSYCGKVGTRWAFIFVFLLLPATCPERLEICNIYVSLAFKKQTGFLPYQREPLCSQPYQPPAAARRMLRYCRLSLKVVQYVASVYAINTNEKFVSTSQKGTHRTTAGYTTAAQSTQVRAAFGYQREAVYLLVSPLKDILKKTVTFEY